MTDKPTLESVIRHYTGIETRKRTIPCPLPSHEDSYPSCSINWERGLWNCHVCAEGGDAWTLIMLIEDCDFKTATSLTKKYDLEMHENEGAGEGVSRWGRPVTRRRRDGQKQKFRPKFTR